MLLDTENSREQDKECSKEWLVKTDPGLVWERVKVSNRKPHIGIFLCINWIFLSFFQIFKHKSTDPKLSYLLSEFREIETTLVLLSIFVSLRKLWNIMMFEGMMQA